MSRKNGATVVSPAPVKAPRAATALYVRAEEKRTCWLYVRTDGHQLFVGDDIYVRKALFGNRPEPPLYLRLSLTIEESGPPAPAAVL